MTAEDAHTATILRQRVQEVPVTIFDQLEAQDILFIDSSHVAKVGSDVAFLMLRVLPRLKSGVLIHFHDIYYPWSYLMQRIRAVCAWNESLFLRALLVGNNNYRITAFNCFAGVRFPELFRSHLPHFPLSRKHGWKLLAQEGGVKAVSKRWLVASHVGMAGTRRTHRDVRSNCFF